MRICPIYLPCFYLLVCCVTFAPTFADVVVISSSGESFKVGDQIGEQDEIILADQIEVRVLNKVTGETRKLIGPYKGKIGEFKSPCSSEGQLSFACSTINRSKPVGASRGPTENAGVNAK